MKRALFYLAHPISLSIIITIILGFLLPEIQKYQTKLTEIISIPSYDKVFYHDFNKDGNSEYVRYFSRYDLVHQSLLITDAGLVIDQWKFEGRSLNENFCFFGDYNNNNSDEVFLVSYQNDSVFLNYFEPFYDKRTFKSKLLLITKNEYGDLAVVGNGLADLNNDGFKEVLMTLNVGYSVQPRMIIAYDIVNDTIYQTPESCYALLDTYIEDVNNDKSYEIFCNGAAFGNCTDTVPYSDQSAWLMAFNNKLQFLFEPIRLGIKPSRVYLKLYRPRSTTYFACLYVYNGKEDQSSLQLFDLQGQLVKKRIFDDNRPLIGAQFLQEGTDYKKLYIVFEKGEIYEINENLDFTKRKQIEPFYDSPIIPLDIDNDENNEFIFVPKAKNKIIITRNDFNDALKLDIPLSNSNANFQVNYLKEKPSQLVVRIDQELLIYEYSINPTFQFRHFIYLGCFLIFLIGIYLLSWISKHRLTQKYKSEKYIAELQIKSLKNQIDPHFTLNIINVIASLFEQNDSEKAYYLFDKYTKILLESIKNSDKIITTLEDKINYIRDYLDLEQSRLSINLRYSIEVEKDVEVKQEIPKMLLYTFVENAVKHGVRHSERPGLLEIKVSQNSIYCMIEIRDNGIGRREAKKHSTYGAGKGLKILDEVLKCFYILTKKRITYKIIDLHNKNSPVGTLVKIVIPVK